MNKNIKQYVEFNKNNADHVNAKRYSFDYKDNIYIEHEFGKFSKQNLLLNNQIVTFENLSKINLIGARLIGIDLSNLYLSYF